ncbi:MAG: DUF2868 domain-containing protein [Burkholderiales bacterium]|nr:DUF2868 domain-containing protein [Burkholderiales bacterium]
MDESAAMKVVAVRAVETVDAARKHWTDADRAWASRAAAETVGADASPDAFLARRAALAIERIAGRGAALPRALRSLEWRPWVGTAVVGLAFALGAFLDQLGGAQRVDILAPPVLGLLVWNVAVYVAIAVGYVVRFGEPAPPGPLRAGIVRFAGGLGRPRGSAGVNDAVVAFGEDWARRATPLYAMRASRILHFAAAALAAGVLAGLYLRGLALEYRASWESTFLDAAAVRSIASWTYWPGAALTGIPVPSVEDVAAIRAPAGENAARWLHLMAATVAAVAILPRLLLALAAGLVERHRASRFPLRLDEPYFQRLLRGYRGGAARVRVIPYSYAVPAPAAAGLEAIVARSFGGSAALLVSAPLAYGEDEALAAAIEGAAGNTLVALFSAAATPEREAHGAFLAELAKRRSEADALFAIVDEGAWAARFAGEPARIEERRGAWRQLCGEAGVAVVFVDLANPDLAATDAALDAAIGDRST